MTPRGRPFLLLLFVLLLATPALVRHFRQGGAAKPGAGTDPVAQYGFRLVESSKAAGLDFVHEAPTLDAQLGHIMPQRGWPPRTRPTDYTARKRIRSMLRREATALLPLIEQLCAPCLSANA